MKLVVLVCDVVELRFADEEVEVQVVAAEADAFGVVVHHMALEEEDQQRYGVLAVAAAQDVVAEDDVHASYAAVVASSFLKKTQLGFACASDDVEEVVTAEVAEWEDGVHWSWEATADVEQEAAKKLQCHFVSYL